MRVNITMLAVDYIKSKLTKNERKSDENYSLYFVNLHVYRYKEYENIMPPLRAGSENKVQSK